MSIQAVFEPDEPIVSMIEWRGIVLVATTRRVYRMVHDSLEDRMTFHPMTFKPLDEQC